VLLGSAIAAHAQAPSFVNFESGQVRPLALSPDGARLYAVNTPDNRLEIFDVGAGGLTHVGAVQVGLEPVAVAARSNSEVWVVNHLSDSVSVVDVSSSPPRVVRTLLVGDEPRDIVFAGTGGNRAFITTAHRGQNIGFDPQLTTAGVGRADVWVFDANNLGTSLGGTPVTIVKLFGDTPRALAVSPDGATVYAAVFFSGNRTTVIDEGGVCDGGAGQGACTAGDTTVPGGLPAPNANVEGQVGPETGLIVKYNSAVSEWQDQLGRNWNNAVRFNLPDYDVFAIDAAATTPAMTQRWSGVGTVLFNMVASPTTPGKIYVSNTDAHNEVRFEGPGIVSGGNTVRGHLHEARITVINGTSVLPRHLNKHINYSQRPSPAGTLDKSLATPVGMAISSDGQTLYVAAFGSSKVGVFSTAQLDANTFVPDTANQIELTGGGPSGLVLDQARGRLYVFTRFDNSISVVDTATRAEIGHQPVYNPEPTNVVAGRPMLYDAAFSSSNGEASCSSCHVFGDLDQLAWDLGNPDDVVTSNPMTI
jgi:YVTN family beta-propeller protein